MSLLQVGLTFGSPDLVPTDLDGITVTVTKLLFVVGALLYLVFAGIVIRQIQLMKNTVQTDFSPFVQILGYVHFAFALVVLLLFLGL